MPRSLFLSPLRSRTPEGLPRIAFAIAILAGPAVARPAQPPVKLTSSFAGQAGDRFGRGVAISGDYAVVGVSRADISSVNQGSARVYRYNTDSFPSYVYWVLDGFLVPSDGAANGSFGAAVAVSGTTVIVGAPNADQGAAYAFVRTAEGWAQQAKLVAPDGIAGDHFGMSVSIAGDTAIVGANRDSAGASAEQGSAYIFVRSESAWVLQAKLNPADGAAGDNFGFSVAISGDTAIVGAPHRDIRGKVDRGAAYVFTRSGTAWSQQARLVGIGGDTGDNFGCSVAISGDTAIVGACLEDVDGNADQGAAHVFIRSGAAWTQQERLAGLRLLFAGAGDQFGYSVAIEGDTALVGAPFLRRYLGMSTGGHYAFKRSGASWSQTFIASGAFAGAREGVRTGFSVGISGSLWIVGAPFVNGSDPPPGQAFIEDYVAYRSGRLEDVKQDSMFARNFGCAVSVSGDTIVAGIKGALVESTDNPQAPPGSAQTFVRSGASWKPQGFLFAMNRTPGSNLGASVAISGDTVVVGAPDDTVGLNFDRGAAYAFTRSGTAWMLQSQLMNAGGQAQDHFGASVAISGDTIVVGAPQETVGTNLKQGSARVFIRTGSAWTSQARLVASDGTPDDAFGASVAVSGDTAVIGSPGADGAQGAAYIFARTGTTWTQQTKLRFFLGRNGDAFGTAVAISDGTIIVGAPGQRGGSSVDQGIAHVFVRSGATWVRQAGLLAPDGTFGEAFGSSVSISGDSAVIGAPRH